MEKIITVDKFFGLNESADGSTELKPGEASKIENFYITDEYNMCVRPGIVKHKRSDEQMNYELAIPVYERDRQWLCCANYDQGARDFTSFFSGNDVRHFELPGWYYKLLTFSGKVISVWKNGGGTGVEAENSDGTVASVPSGWVGCTYFDIAGNQMLHRVPYEPMVITGSAPSGGGAPLEKLNILTPYFRAGFAGDGTSKDYFLPGNTDDVLSITIDTETRTTISDIGAWDADTHVFTFNTAPEEQTEVTFRCKTNDTDLEESMKRFLRMKRHEYFNGATDTRIFFYGDGTNITYYTGVPAFGEGLYVPAGNELAVDFSDSAITGMIRHYSRLLVYKPDGVESIVYDTITLADGSMIPAFYLQPVSRAYGNDAMGQLQLVNNSPRSFTGQSIYEWRVSSSSYRDERYAKDISQKVSNTISGADLSKVVAFDDDADQTYYVFLNDNEGTVLVNRYNLDCWTIYRSPLTKKVSHAFAFGGKTMFIADMQIYMFDKNSRYDECSDPETGAEKAQIRAVYESGFLSFGADYKRKYSSKLWFSLLPQVASQIEITVKTDKRGEYTTKSIGYSLLDFSQVDFSNFSFDTYLAPKIKRVQIKVKKFVYYKLIFKVTKAGARATILSYDQQVRFASDAK